MRACLLVYCLLLAACAAAQKSYVRNLSVQDPCTGVGMYGNTMNAELLYPNPNQGFFTLFTASFGEATLLDVTGAVVMYKQITSRETAWDVAHLKQGVYLLNFIGEHKLIRYKIIIER